MKKPLSVENLFPEISLIEDDDLRSKVEEVWHRLWTSSEFEDVHDMPVSVEINYEHIRHNQSVLLMALAVADVLDRVHNIKLDRDVLVAGAILQDASKLVEMRPDQGTGIQDTELGSLFPHAFWAAHVALECGVPKEICEIILHHTPQAASFPRSLEGKVLYYVDQIDVIAIYRDRWFKQMMITK